MAKTTVTLNPGTGGAAVAAWTDATSAAHQLVAIETQTGVGDPVPVGATNPLPVITSGTNAVVGNVAAGVADAGNGVKISGIYNSALPVYTSGQRADFQLDANGRLIVNIGAGGGTGGTASNFSAAFPAQGTAAGFLNSAGTLLAPGNLDASGNLKVNIASGAAQAFTDTTSTFTASSTQGLAVGYVYNDTGIAIASNALGLARMTTNRQVRVVVDAATNGGLTPYGLVQPAIPAATAVKASAGQLGWVHASNDTATPVYIKWFNLATGSVTLGTTAALFQTEIPGNTGGAGYTSAIPQGVSFSTAITYAVTGGIALNDNTSITASKVNVAVGYA